MGVTKEPRRPLFLHSLRLNHRLASHAYLKARLLTKRCFRQRPISNSFHHFHSSLSRRRNRKGFHSRMSNRFRLNSLIGMQTPSQVETNFLVTQASNSSLCQLLPKHKRLSLQSSLSSQIQIAWIYLPQLVKSLSPANPSLLLHLFWSMDLVIWTSVDMTLLIQQVSPASQ